MARIDAKLRAALSGIIGVLVTPFDRDDRLAPERLKPIVDRAVGAGVHALTANGNTGEFFALTTEEAITMVHAVAGQIAGRCILVGGVGRSLHDARALARASCVAGAGALMVHQPSDPFVSPRGLVRYVQTIADAAEGVPMMLYLRNDRIGLDTIERLCAVAGVAGVMWACPTPLHLGEVMRRCNPDLIWVDGLAELWALPFAAIGTRGFTSGLINVWPEHSVDIYNALEKGDYGHARNLIDIMSGFGDLRSQEQEGTNVTVVKGALQLLGIDCGATRPPSAWPLSPDQSTKLIKQLDAWGLRKDAVRPASARA